MTRHVTLICGPPCGGKTTLAGGLADPGGFVLDLDAIARRLGSPTSWRHQPHIVERAEEIFRYALNQLAVTEDVTAFVVRCAPHPGQRHQIARGIRADAVYVLTPPMSTCLARANADRRPGGTLSSIRTWYRIYRPDKRDTPCPPELLAPAGTRDAAGCKAAAPGTPNGSPGTAPTARAPAPAGTTPAGNVSSRSRNGSSSPNTDTTSASTAASPPTKRGRPATR